MKCKYNKYLSSGTETLVTTCHDTIVTKDKHVMEHVNSATELLASFTTTHHDALCRQQHPKS